MSSPAGASSKSQPRRCRSEYASEAQEEAVLSRESQTVCLRSLKATHPRSVRSLSALRKAFTYRRDSHLVPIPFPGGAASPLE